MQLELVSVLRCPRTGQGLRLEQAKFDGVRIRSGLLVSENGKNSYAIRDYIPRFVCESNYADSFGMQWNKFRKTQLDSHSGHPISANRFWKATAWDPTEMAGQWVLDAGCGAGRFAEVVLQTKARVVALDYSSAVDACYASLGHHENLHVVQGDIYSLPFPKGLFSFVYSLGVLQHTPDVHAAFAALPPMVASGGGLCVDVYMKTWKSALLPKYWLRPVTKRMSKSRLSAIVESWVPKALPLSQALGRVPFFGRGLKRLVPVANYHDILPLTEAQQVEWSVLDTFDWLAPEYDSPQSPETVKRWLQEGGLDEIKVFVAGHLVGRGQVP